MADHQQPQKTGRAWKWVLGVSLALNLVVIGLIAGAMFRFSGGGIGPGPLGPSLQSFGAPFVWALPKEARRDLRRQLRSDDSGLPSRAERRAHFSTVIQALRDDPFDRSKVEDLFKIQADVAQKVQAHGQKRWLELVSEMSVAERRALADRVEEGARRGGKRKKNRGKD